MAKLTADKPCCDAGTKSVGGYKVQSLLSVDERGQILLPKDLRNKAAIKPGDKLVAVTWEKDDKICCISLLKADDFSGMVKGILGPFVKDILK